MSRRALSDLPPDTFDDGRDAERDEVADDSDSGPTAADAPDIDFDFEPGAVQAGTEIIRRFWSTLPSSPGVYRMFDHRGDVLYVGKAKNLKARVGSYARGQAHSNRIARMISQTAAMEFVTTATETEALLLEANLIKQLKPRFNVLMRDDKSFPYILVTEDGAGPADRQASGCAASEGQLLRSLRQRLGGQPHGERPAAGLPAAHLHRQLLREPHPALPALPDQALLRSLHGRDRGTTITPPWRMRPARSWRASRTP